jgi:cytochrome c biogenesis protein CcmG, thiol:disulfide interchange protein DsbE
MLSRHLTDRPVRRLPTRSAKFGLMSPGKTAASTAFSRLAGRVRRLGLAGQIAGTIAAVLLAVVAVLTLAGPSGTAGTQPKTLPTAPNFTLPELGHKDRIVSLAGYAGKPVIVNFFASWCAECQTETPELARFYRQGHGRTVIIGIDANDSTARALPWLAGKGVTYPVGVDAHGLGPATAYGVNALPQTFFLDAQHRIVKRIYGAVTASDLRQGVELMDDPAAALSASG